MASRRALVQFRKPSISSTAVRYLSLLPAARILPSASSSSRLAWSPSRALSRAAPARAAISPTKCGLWTDHSLPPTFKKILIANRGEIACRVIRTCRELGVRTVAVFSDADADSMHVQMADEAFRIGEPPAAKSYLLMEKIIEVAKQSGSEAIHPGYGFLSENEHFAKLCQDHGVKFIGPPVKAIQAMGSKSASKIIMTDAKVPVVPGYHGEDQSPVTLKKEADRVGYPIMLKAVLGGGGKGMRIVEKKEDFDEMLEACKREAKASFGDDRVLLERYIVRPRHIEFQIFADQKGNAVHLYERDCSVQRRHQKVLEEAPAPGMSEELRRKMGKSACDAAKAVGYEGAGTVEFIFDADTDEYFFMEMNTRLQVEHCVSEMIVRRDFVQWQLHVAAGYSLPATQDELSAYGNAIEARIYAENPANNFLPCTGHLAHIQAPPVSPELRVETGVRTGDQVSIFYDPMISKLVVWGPDRHAALRRMANALRQYEIVGPPTNIGFVLRCIQNPEFAKGQVTTAFIKTHLDTLLPALIPQSRDATSLALLHLLLKEHKAAVSQAQKSQDPWDSVSMWRSNLRGVRSASLIPHSHAPRPADAPPLAPIGVEISTGAHDAQHLHYSFKFVDGAVVPTRVTLSASISPAHSRAQTISAVIGDRKYTATVVENGKEIHVLVGGDHYMFLIPEKSYSSGSEGSAASKIMSPMSGKIVKVLVKAGQKVPKGASLVIMEAMKMEHIIRAPREATVEKVFFEAGDFVDGGKAVVALA